MPTLVASGLICLMRPIWSATGFMSLVPVTLPPGASFDATRSADLGSVTAVNTIGTLVMAWAAACAAGVAMASTRSRFSEASFVAMLAAVP